MLAAAHADQLESAAGAPGGVLVRWLATVIDTALGLLASLLAAILFALAGLDAQTGVEAAILLWFVVYPPLMIAFADGQTHGKRAMGIRAQRAAGEPIGLGRAIARESILKLAFTLIPLGLVVDAIVARSDERRRSIHDRVVGTRVVTVARSR